MTETAIRAGLLYQLSRSRGPDVPVSIRAPGEAQLAVLVNLAVDSLRQVCASYGLTDPLAKVGLALCVGLLLTIPADMPTTVADIERFAPLWAAHVEGTALGVLSRHPRAQDAALRAVLMACEARDRKAGQP